MKIMTAPQIMISLILLLLVIVVMRKATVITATIVETSRSGKETYEKLAKTPKAENSGK